MTISSDTSTPLVVVIGATGQQGGSVIRALSESDRTYRIRGITRDLTKAAVKALTDQGVEMVSATISAEKTGDLEKAFQGASYIFSVTNFWEGASKNKEISDGKTVVDAAKTIPGLKLFIWSGLEDFAAISNGKYTLVDHFDGKAEVTQYAKDQGLPLSNVQAGMYMSNFLNIGAPVKQADGTYLFFGTADASTTVPLIDTPADYGKFVRAAIEHPGFGAGSEVLGCGDEISWEAMTKQLSEGTGKQITYTKITEEQFLAFAPMPERIAREMYQMSECIGEFGYFAGKDVKPSQGAVKGQLTTWSEYVKNTDWSKILN